MPTIKFYKVVDDLPTVLDTDAVYFLKVDDKLEMYVTDHLTGTAIQVGGGGGAGSFVPMVNIEAVTIKKGQAVYGTATGGGLAQSRGDVATKLIGLAAADIPAGVEGVVQISGLLEMTNAEWAAAHTEGVITPGVPYFLSNVYGQVDRTPEDGTVTPAWSVKVGIGLTSTKFLIKLEPSIKL